MVFDAVVGSVRFRPNVPEVNAICVEVIVPAVLSVPPLIVSMSAERFPAPLSVPPFNDSEESATSVFRFSRCRH